MFFKHFASKNYLPGFYISGTFVENGLKYNLRFLYFMEKSCFILKIFDFFYSKPFYEFQKLWLMTSISAHEIENIFEHVFWILNDLVVKLDQLIKWFGRETWPTNRYSYSEAIFSYFLYFCFLLFFMFFIFFVLLCSVFCACSFSCCCGHLWPVPAVLR